MSIKIKTLILILVFLILTVSLWSQTNELAQTNKILNRATSMVKNGQTEKEGDVINIISFDTEAQIRHQNLSIPADLNVYNKAILDLKPKGSTNLNAGIVLGYQAALDSYDPKKSNCVIILTDAYANTGEIDPKIITQNIRINDSEGIHFSGLGISSDFNDDFLNELTDIGKGAYFSIITPSDARRTFEQCFEALLNVAAKDVKFRLDFPQSLIRDVTASEESSSDENKVSSTNFSYNTSQYFFEGFKLNSAELKPHESFKLTVSYTNPDNGTKIEKFIEYSVKVLLGKDEKLIHDAQIIFLFNELLAKTKTELEIESQLKGNFNEQNYPLYREYQNLMKQYLSSQKKSIIVSPTIKKKTKKKKKGSSGNIIFVTSSHILSGFIADADSLLGDALSVLNSYNTGVVSSQ